MLKVLKQIKYKKLEQNAGKRYQKNLNEVLVYKKYKHTPDQKHLLEQLSDMMEAYIKAL